MSQSAVLFRLLAPLVALAIGATAEAGPEPVPNPDQPAQPAATEPEPEHASPFSASGSLAFNSRYLFQGIDYSAGKPVLNPELDAAAGPIAARVWVNHDLDQNVANEFDLSVFHEWSLKKASLATGYTYLKYPHREGWDPSQELYIEMSHEGVVSPSLSVHYDFDAGDGSYSTLGFSRSVERPFGTLSFGTNLFYQDHYYGLTGIPSNEWNVRLTKTVHKVSFTPSMSRFVTWTNGDFRDENAVKSAWLFSLQVARDL